MTNKKLQCVAYALSTGTKVDDLGWPWAAISSNFLGILCCRALTFALARLSCMCTGACDWHLFIKGDLTWLGFPCISLPNSQYRYSKLDACCFHWLFLRLLDWDEAARHFQEMTDITKCRRPVPEMVDVRAMQHEANRDYLPSCTLVYRCRKQLGCCDESSQCSVKTSNIIVRTFIVSCFVSFNIVT